MDNFNNFCGPGKEYRGTYVFHGPVNSAEFEIDIKFNKANESKENTIDGVLTFYCFSLKKPNGVPYRYPFSVTCEAASPITGKIDNKCPTLKKFQYAIDYENLSVDSQHGAVAFYNQILNNSTGIEIRFTNTMELSITGNGGNNIKPAFEGLRGIPKRPGPPPVRKETRTSKSDG
jgi:hypothetical protein